MTYLLIAAAYIVLFLVFIHTNTKKFSFCQEKKFRILYAAGIVINIIFTFIGYKNYIKSMRYDTLNVVIVNVLFALIIPLFLSTAFMSLFVCIMQKIKKDNTPLYFIKTKKGNRGFVSVNSIAILCSVIIIFSAAVKLADISTFNYSDWRIEDNTRVAMNIKGTYPAKIAIKIGKREGGLTDENVQEYFSGGLLDLEYPLCSLSAEKLSENGNDINKDSCNIVVVGDSFVWGDGLTNQNDVFWNQLSYEMERRGYDCNVIGVGVGGANTYDELKWLSNSTLVEDLQPDIIIIGYVNNDPVVCGVTDEKTSDSDSIVEDYAVEIFERFYPNVGYILKSRRISGAGSVSWCENLLTKENLDIYEKYAVAPLAEWEKNSGIPVAVVTLPSQPNKEYYNTFYEPVAEIFNKNGLKFYNNIDVYCDEFAAKKHSENYIVNPVNAHPGTASNYFYAQYTADFLEKDYSDILVKSSPEYKTERNIRINDCAPSDIDAVNTVSTSTECKVSFTYPAADTEYSFLYMPIKENYVELNFEYPVDISDITVQGDLMESADIYYRCVNPELGYDDTSLVKLGSIDDNNKTISDEKSAYVTGLCIHAETENLKAADIELTVHCREGGVGVWRP